MAKLSKIPIEEAKALERGDREATILLEYRRYIESLATNEAGKFTVKDRKEGYAVRARLKRAAQAAGEPLVIHKRGEDIVFWKERSESTNSGS